MQSDTKEVSKIMKAIYYNNPLDLNLMDTDIHPVSRGEMLLKVKAAAVCGTDLRILKSGHFKIPPGTKRVLGHEIAGEIVEVGSDVRGYKNGMRVSIIPNIGCGQCAMCVKGQNQLCPVYEAFGISLDGGFQEYMLITENAINRGNVVQIPDQVSYEEAALIEPLSCVYSTYNVLRTKPGDTVLIVGAGPIGACHVMMSKLAGAGKIIVADISDARLKEVREFGADVLIDSSREELGAALMKETDGFGADVIITANSAPEIQTQSLELAAPLGRISFFGGMSKNNEMVTLNTNLIHYKNLQVFATTGSSISDYHHALQIVASGRIPLIKTVTKRFDLINAQKAFEYSSSGVGMKALIISED